MAFLAGDRLTADALNLATRKVLARAVRTTASSTTTTTVGVLRLDDVPILAGRVYEIRSNPLHLLTTVANDVAFASFRITTDGSTPTTASTLLALAQRRLGSVADQAVGLAGMYTPAVNETLSVLLCVTRSAGTGNVRIDAGAGFPIAYAIYDLGEDPGDTGVDV